MNRYEERLREITETIAFHKGQIESLETERTGILLALKFDEDSDGE